MNTLVKSVYLIHSIFYGLVVLVSFYFPLFLVMSFNNVKFAMLLVVLFFIPIPNRLYDKKLLLYSMAYTLYLFLCMYIPMLSYIFFLNKDMWPVCMAFLLLFVIDSPNKVLLTLSLSDLKRSIA